MVKLTVFIRSSEPYNDEMPNVHEKIVHCRKKMCVIKCVYCVNSHIRNTRNNMVFNRTTMIGLINTDIRLAEVSVGFILLVETVYIMTITRHFYSVLVETIWNMNNIFPFRVVSMNCRLRGSYVFIAIHNTRDGYWRTCYNVQEWTFIPSNIFNVMLYPCGGCS